MKKNRTKGQPQLPMRNNTFTLQVETENGHCVKEIRAHDRRQDPTKWESPIDAAM